MRNEYSDEKLMSNNKKITIDTLINVLIGKDYFTVEEVSEKLGVNQADVHRVLLKLRVQPGWSIIESNHTAYGRSLVGPHTASNRWRKKHKTASDYDPYEPEWTPTTFHIAKRP